MTLYISEDGLSYAAVTTPKILEGLNIAEVYSSLMQSPLWAQVPLYGSCSLRGN